MAESFCQRVRLLLTHLRRWSHILKKPLTGCKAPINEAYLNQTRTAMRILWTGVLEGKDRHFQKSVQKCTSPLSENPPKLTALLVNLRALTFENAAQAAARIFSCGTSARIRSITTYGRSMTRWHAALQSLPPFPATQLARVPRCSKTASKSWLAMRRMRNGWR